MRSLPAGALLAAITLGVGGVRAQEPAADVEALVLALDGQLAELRTADCDTACAALASLRRSAEAICELDPGDRCEASRDKVADAEERVRERCPDCDEAQTRRGKPAAVPGPPSKPLAGVDDVDEEMETQPSEGPAAVERSGGCAACTVGSPAPRAGGLAMSLWGLLALALARRRRD